MTCHWKKIQDETNKKVYLYRKCYCKVPTHNVHGGEGDSGEGCEVM